ncbi:hypothetical protein CL630_03530 [bacterium]|nr:hypothetical protein [bacterium]
MKYLQAFINIEYWFWHRAIYINPLLFPFFLLMPFVDISGMPTLWFTPIWWFTAVFTLILWWVTLPMILYLVDSGKNVPR